MVRGQKDIAASILQEIITAPNSAPTRIIARAGANYRQTRALIEADLIKLREWGKDGAD
jgi:predicted transcriptional regulator